MRVCNQFNECQLAQGLVHKTDLHTIWDVGCATGGFYRFFRQVFHAVEYRGFDISEAAIEHARQRYPEGEFNVFNGDLSGIAQAKPDLIFCRDVVHHQPDPAEFLAKLYQAAGRYLAWLSEVPTARFVQNLREISVWISSSGFFTGV